jgi:hypothetical protein
MGTIVSRGCGIKECKANHLKNSCRWQELMQQYKRFSVFYYYITRFQSIYDLEKIMLKCKVHNLRKIVISSEREMDAMEIATLKNIIIKTTVPICLSATLYRVLFTFVHPPEHVKLIIDFLPKTSLKALAPCFEEILYQKAVSDHEYLAYVPILHVSLDVRFEQVHGHLLYSRDQLESAMEKSVSGSVSQFIAAVAQNPHIEELLIHKNYSRTDPAENVPCNRLNRGMSKKMIKSLFQTLNPAVKSVNLLFSVDDWQEENTQRSLRTLAKLIYNFSPSSTQVHFSMEVEAMFHGNTPLHGEYYQKIDFKYFYTIFDRCEHQPRETLDWDKVEKQLGQVENARHSIFKFLSQCSFLDSRFSPSVRQFLFSGDHDAEKLAKNMKRDWFFFKRQNDIFLPITPSSNREILSLNLGTCAICLNDEKENPHVLPLCGHIFCLACIDMLAEKACPICKCPFDRVQKLFF